MVGLGWTWGQVLLAAAIAMAGLTLLALAAAPSGAQAPSPSVVILGDGLAAGTGAESQFRPFSGDGEYYGFNCRRSSNGFGELFAARYGLSVNNAACDGNEVVDTSVSINTEAGSLQNADVVFLTMGGYESGGRDLIARSCLLDDSQTDVCFRALDIAETATGYRETQGYIALSTQFQTFNPRLLPEEQAAVENHDALIDPDSWGSDYIETLEQFGARPGNLTTAERQAADNTAERFKGTLRSTLEKVERFAPDAYIFVVGYPSLVSPHCPGTPAALQNRIGQFESRLNADLKEIALDARRERGDVEYVELSHGTGLGPGLTGDGPCGTSPAVHHIDYDSDLGREVHPNEPIENSILDIIEVAIILGGREDLDSFHLNQRGHEAVDNYLELPLGVSPGGSAGTPPVNTQPGDDSVDSQVGGNGPSPTTSPSSTSLPQLPAPTCSVNNAASTVTINWQEAGSSEDLRYRIENRTEQVVSGPDTSHTVGVVRGDSNQYRVRAFLHSNNSVVSPWSAWSSVCVAALPPTAPGKPACVNQADGRVQVNWAPSTARGAAAVSYTHLTLPTIYSV